MKELKLATEIVNGYLDDLYASGFYDEEEFQEFAEAIEFLICIASRGEDK